MSEQTIVYAEMHKVIDGKRKYLPNAVARVIASRWHGGQTSALYSLTSCGAMDAERLHAEINRAADELATSDDYSDDAYGCLIALDVYVSRVKSSRKPVLGWAELWVEAA